MAAGRLSFSAFVLLSVVSAFSINAEAPAVRPRSLKLESRLDQPALPSRPVGPTIQSMTLHGRNKHSSFPISLCCEDNQRQIRMISPIQFLAPRTA
ncbi:hypothetical protein IW261DRAFT_1510880 [Armillaria novae-zelandiae]|uniref:Hydrophobin n=1 Tax=Armillaria novae-zelandiae TaxID=153914 RepID=A0AA39NTT2_9AGAR|nr:hypothetical protein IW261DRAFT_1510880 [Armillaria novae-zelandiae]